MCLIEALARVWAGQTGGVKEEEEEEAAESSSIIQDHPGISLD